MTQLIQDVLLPRGGAERVFWTLQRSARFARVLVGLNADAALCKIPDHRALVTMRAHDLNDPRDGLARVVDAIHREPRLDNPSLLLHHHVGLQFDLPAATSTVYLHTPTRFLWEPELATWEHDVFTGGQIDDMRERELRAIHNARAVVTNSHCTADRIERIYGRSASVVHPPVELWKVDSVPPRRQQIVGAEPYVIAVSRLVSAKGLEQLLEATEALGLNLVVVGSGRDGERLTRMAGPRVTFAGDCTDAELRWFLKRSAVFASSAVEDFGIAIVEALCEGVPCVVPDGGGAAETVAPEAGRRYRRGDSRGLALALAEALEIGRLAPGVVAGYRERFGSERFLTLLTRALHARRPRPTITPSQREGKRWRAPRDDGVHGSDGRRRRKA